MISIKKLRLKNFLSFGNVFTEIDLNTVKATLVRGKNGSGKSAIALDAVIYALYGKPYRSINKVQLVNSINNRDMIVELEFQIGSIEYMIRRGMKPQIFDIIRDGVLVEQDAATRDYQFFLETQILKVSERTFKQIAVLGSASYVPFMQLPAGARRELIESILDIEIFSRMNTVLRDRVATTKEEFKNVTNAITIKKTEAMGQQKLITVMKENTKSRVEDYRAEKKTYEDAVARFELKISDEEFMLGALEEPEFDNASHKTLTNRLESHRREVTSLRKKLASVSELDECPSCLQTVTVDHVHHLGKSIEGQIFSLENLIHMGHTDFAISDAKRELVDVYYEQHKEISNAIIATRQSERNATVQLEAINEKIQILLSRNDDVEAEENKLKSIGSEAMELIERKNLIGEEKHLQDVAIQLLKDTGIKTAVVKEYLPVLNKLINKYLAMFDFFVEFTLDESFNEVIKSRARDAFSYSSFSEGEKRRIDFSILMAFRQMAALKNSAKTNVLVIDELLDGALDLNAREAFNELIGSIPDSNIIVISHADANADHYDRIIHVEKVGDFSEYEIIM